MNIESLSKRTRPLLGYLPTGSHEPQEGYTGLFSYSVEVHAFLIGMAAGIATGTTGDLQLAMSVLTVALTVGRGQQHLTDTVKAEIRKEPQYAIGGVFVGFAIAYALQFYGVI